MPAGEIDLSMSGDPKAILRAFNSINKKIDKMERGLKKVGSASKKSTGDLSGGMEKASGQVAKFVGSLAGIGTAAGGVYAIAKQLKAEYEHLVKRQTEAGRAQLTVGQARAQALYNLPAHFPVELLEAGIKKYSQQHGVTQGTIWRGVGDPLSAIGNVPPKVFMEQMGEALRAAGVGGMDYGVVHGAMLDMTKLAGVKDPRRALGSLRQAGGAMRVTTLPKQIRAIMPVIAAAEPMGWTAETAMEILAYFTGGSSDIMGEQASTGTVMFMKTLQDAMTVNKAIIPEMTTSPWGDKRKLTFRPLKGGTGPQRLKEVQDWYAGAPEDLRREFKAKMPGEAKIKGPILSLFARDPKAMAAYGAAQEAIDPPTTPGLERRLESWYDAINLGKQEPVRKVDRTFVQFIEELQLTDPGAMAGVIRKRLPEAMAAITGTRDIDIKVAKAMFELRTGLGEMGPSKAIEAAVGQLIGIRGGTAWRRVSKWGFQDYVSDLPEGAERVPRPLSERLDFMKEYSALWGDTTGNVYMETERREHEQAPLIQLLIELLEEVKAELRNSRGTDEAPMKVKVVEYDQSPVMTVSPE